VDFLGTIYGVAIVTEAPISTAPKARAVRGCMDLMIVSGFH
jgi:hypothetical protein